LKDIELSIEKQLDDLKNAKREREVLIKELEKDWFTEKRMRKREKNEEEME